MATLTSWKRQVTNGTRLLCVSNTLRPELDGTTRTITRAGPTVCVAQVDADGLREWPIRMVWPKASDVVAITDDEITYRLGRPGPDGVDHTVTLRLIGGDE